MIEFYKLKDKYGNFSNFSRHPIVVNGKKYLTTEHYYQSKKFEGTEFEDIIRCLNTAREAKDIGSGDKPYIKDGLEIKFPKLRSDWEEVKYEIMKDALRYKVQQHKEIEELLLSTGDEEIVESTTNDYIWGCGLNKTGKNLLGKAWMDIRKELWRNSAFKT